MSGHLCLKWNNHSSAFLKSISNIHIKERYCDATIACQGKYFPVHRVVLSTCSDYFDEMFERMQCPHPYIVFKDIEPREMELLLNYMYQGEVNVVQELLPTLIKAAEALKVKGLAVPDDMPSNKDSSCGKKRSNTSNDNPQPKRRSEESSSRRRRRDSSEFNSHSQTTDNSDGSSLQNSEAKLIKEEPLDGGDYTDGALDAADFGDAGLPGDASTLPSHSNDSLSKSEDVFANFPVTGEGVPFIKAEPSSLLPHEDPYEEQSSSWSDFGSGSVMSNLATSEVPRQDDMSLLHPSSIAIPSMEDDVASSHGNPMGSGNPPFCHPVSSRQFSSRLLPYNNNSNTNSPSAQGSNPVGPFNLKPHRCTLCLFRCRLKKNLALHMRVHTGERPFQCPHCRSKFRQKSHLNSHMRKKFKCPKMVTLMNQDN